MEDYDVCRSYPELEIVVPVDSRGYLTGEAGEFAGLYYEKSNAKIIEKLKETDALLAIEEIVHSYPHCWRCKAVSYTHLCDYLNESGETT